MMIFRRVFLWSVFPFLLLFMPIQGFSTVTSYSELLQAIREVRNTSQARIEAAVEQEKVREAWETGKLIEEHILFHKERADYGKQVMIKLAKDLGTSETELKYMLQFFRAYPIRPSTDELPWGHYRELLSINDDGQRGEMARQAKSQNWSQKEIRRQIRKQKLSAAEESPKLKEVTLGKPGVYRVIRPVKGPYEGQLVYDLGFEVFYKPEKKIKFKEGEIVNTLRNTLGVEEDIYTYSAAVLSVYDGDTFHGLIDLGFGITLQNRLRLRSLDAPEILSSEGKKAKDILEKVLARDKGKILIRTSKDADQHGRYLADIWVKNENIDRELLDSGWFTLREDE